jgi:hypothetical protein
MNYIPESVLDMEFDDYEKFLAQRMALMARYMKNYYLEA